MVRRPLRAAVSPIAIERNRDHARERYRRLRAEGKCQCGKVSAKAKCDECRRRGS
jgi:hypothetical protein